MVKVFSRRILPATGRIHTKSAYMIGVYHRRRLFTRVKAIYSAFFRYRSWSAMLMPTNTLTPLGPLAVRLPQADSVV